MESCVRGYHAYKDIWEASVGEELQCQREIGNRADPFAVAVIKSGQTVGHIPRRISSVCSFFLRRSGVITVRTTERRRFSADLPQGGLEIPCVITFEGTSKETLKARKLVTAALADLSTITKSSTDAVQPSKRRKIEDDCVKEKECNKAEADTREWVQCGGNILTNYDRKILATGQKLTDQHINFAQTLLRSQFQSSMDYSLHCTSPMPKVSNTMMCIPFKSSTPVGITGSSQQLYSVIPVRSGCMTLFTPHWMIEHIRLSRACLAATEVSFE